MHYSQDINAQQLAARVGAAGNPSASGANAYLGYRNPAQGNFYNVVPTAATAGATAANSTALNQQQLLTHQFAALNAQFPGATAAAGGQYMLYSVPSLHQAAAAGAPAPGVSYATSPQAYPQGYLLPQNMILTPNSAAQYTQAATAAGMAASGQDAMSIYASRLGAYRNPLGGANLYAQQQQQQQQQAGAPSTTAQGSTVQGSAAGGSPAAAAGLGNSSTSHRAGHDTPLVVTGEFGLDSLFSGVEKGIQAWPASLGNGQSSHIGEVAARRLMPNSANQGIPSQAAIASLMTYGFDTETLGFALSEEDPVYPTISALPYDRADRCILPEYHTPEIYRKAKPQVLSMKLYNSFTDLNLFYIFYSMPGDVLHIAAARCLYERNWMFYKKARFWCRIPKELRNSQQSGAGATPPQDPNNNMWEVFDTSSWSIKRITRVLEMREMEKYERIKDRMSKAADSKNKKAAATSSSATPNPTTATSQASSAAPSTAETSPAVTAPAE